jgi:hypothetical protein
LKTRFCGLAERDAVTRLSYAKELMENLMQLIENEEDEEDKEVLMVNSKR